jgi:hypothetical protein
LSIASTGFEELKLAVKSCVEKAKNKVIKERCSDLKIKLKKFTDRLFTQLEDHIKINLKDKDSRINKIELEYAGTFFDDWFTNVNNFFHNNMLYF